LNRAYYENKAMMSGVLKIIAVSVGVILLVTLFSIALPQGLIRPDDATRVLESQGYSEIEITGWRPFMAGKEDTFSTGFRAKSPSGQIITGAVTSGWLKGSMIRID
jgi:hypothetical protein